MEGSSERPKPINPKPTPDNKPRFTPPLEQKPDLTQVGPSGLDKFPTPLNQLPESSVPGQNGEFQFDSSGESLDDVGIEPTTKDEAQWNFDVIGELLENMKSGEALSEHQDYLEEIDSGEIVNRATGQPLTQDEKEDLKQQAIKSREDEINRLTQERDRFREKWNLD